MIKNFLLASKDLDKVLNNGCVVCRNSNFKKIETKGFVTCEDCGASYYPVSEGLLDSLEYPESTFEVYRPLKGKRYTLKRTVSKPEIPKTTNVSSR